MEFTYEITEDDYIKFNVAYAMDNPTLKKLDIAVKWGFALLFPFVGYFLIPVQPIGIIIFGLTAIIWVLRYDIMQKKNRIKIYTKTYKRAVQKKFQGAENEFTGVRTLRFTENTIQEIHPNRMGEATYSQIQAIKTNGEYYFIYSGVMTAYILPVRVLQSKEQELALLQFLKQKTNLEVEDISL